MSWHPTDERVKSALERLGVEARSMTDEELARKIRRTSSLSAIGVLRREQQDRIFDKELADEESDPCASTGSEEERS